jgi:RimJ/RimL family protein N-acetyltransferase
MNIDDIQVREFSGDDIAGFLDYWYDSDPAFLKSLGVNPGKLPNRHKMREMLELDIRRQGQGGNRPSALLAIALKGRTIGVHELTHLRARPGGGGTGFESGVMHAHIWRPEHRGRGIALVSYVRAMQEYFRRFRLDAVLFESPVHNRGANRIKDKLGIAATGESTMRWPLLDGAVRTLQYRVVPADLPAIERRMRAAWDERR